MRHRELTDVDRELSALLIPCAARGRPRVEDRQVINGMVYKIRTGVSWRDLPERYGPWKTLHALPPLCHRWGVCPRPAADPGSGRCRR
ncbi:transposase [Streptomyces sp. NPDC048270]|uniref:transposase n=1 Tax=Streptomyces sp. NPDC048270 TaxID=3154615 RepID=UPI0033FD740A